MWRFLGDKKKPRSGARIGGTMKKKRSTPKMSGLVLAALRNLRDARGSTAKEIMKYIMAEYNASEATVQRQLKTALKRGVEYGILKKTVNGYSLNTDAEVVGPFDMGAPVDACKKKRTCRPKPKCKPKRKACPKKKKRTCKKKRKRNPCNVCSTRGRKSDCNAPVRLLKEHTPTMDDNSCGSVGESENARSVDEENDQAEGQQPQEQQNRGRSQSKPNGAGSRSRSASKANSNYSDEVDDDEDML